MMTRYHSLVLALALASGFTALSAQPGPGEAAVRRVLEEQQTAWNRGDVDAFMSGYDDSPATTFVGKSVTHGFGQVLESYHHRYPTKEKMGVLTFSELEVRTLGSDYASVIGKWHLVRTAEAGGDVGGIFTLLFHKTRGGWKIILDHTS